MAKTETLDDQVSRLRAMVTDDGGTWDLSWKDKRAIEMALRLIRVIEFAGKGRHDLEACFNERHGHPRHRLELAGMDIECPTLLESFIHAGALLEMQEFTGA